MLPHPCACWCASSIRCKVDLEDAKIRNIGSSGQCFANAEDKNPDFETVRTKFGMECRIQGCATENVFGIAWATDYEGPSDCRTWYAADPTLDK